MRYAANVVFMSMGDEQRGKGRSPLGNELRIRHLDVRSCLAGMGEGDTAIHHQPAAVVAVEV